MPFYVSEDILAVYSDGSSTVKLTAMATSSCLAINDKDPVALTKGPLLVHHTDYSSFLNLSISSSTEVKYL